jgi:hypothetical protein
MRTPVLLPAPPVLPGLALLVGTDVDEISVVWRPAFDDSTPTNALGYEVHVSENPNFEPSPVTLAGTFWGTVQGTVDGLQPNTTYHVLVVAVDGDGLGSLEREYRSVGTPEFPVVLSATTPLEDAESLGLGEPVVDGSQLTFTPSGPATLPTVGAVLFGHVAELGYLRRVDSVEDTGDQVIVQTSDASLSDFVDQMSLSMNVVLFEADPVAPPVAPRSGDTAGEPTHMTTLSWSTGHLISRQTGPLERSGGLRGDFPVTLEKEFKFEPGFRVDSRWRLTGLESAEVVASGTMTAGFSITYEFFDDYDDEHSLEFFSRDWTVTFWIGNVPIMATISLTLTGEIAVSAQAAFTASVGVTATGEARVGATYDQATGWSPFYEDEFEIHPPEASASGMVQASGDVRLVPEVAVTFFPVIPAASVGGSVSAEPFVHGEMEAQTGPILDCPVEFTKFDADLGVECNTALSLRILHLSFPDVASAKFCEATKPIFSLPEIDLDRHVVPAGIGNLSDTIQLVAVVSDGTNNAFAPDDGTHPEWFVSPATPLTPEIGSRTTILECPIPGTYSVTFKGHGSLTFFAPQCEQVSVPCPVEGPLYNLDAIAISGSSFPDLGTVQRFGIGASINNDGNVAFTARDTNGVDALLVEEAGEIESYLGPVVTFSLDDYVQIDDTDRVIWHERSEDGFFKNIKRIGRDGQDFLIVALNHFPPYQTSPFDLPLEWVTMNNGGDTVFSADIDSETFLVSGDTVNGYFGTAFTGFPEIFPMVADNDTIIARAGGDSSDPLLLYTDLTFGSAFQMAGSPEFLAVGQSPGLSDDGQLLAFMGHSQADGVGIFAALGVGPMGEPPQPPFKIAGDSGFSSLSLVPRVGVNRSSAESDDEYTIVYLATSDSGSPGPLGLYTTRVNVSNPGVPVISDPTLVVEVGDVIDGVPGVVEDLALYDPVNTQGQLVFRMRTSEVQAIVRARP